MRIRQLADVGESQRAVERHPGGHERRRVVAVIVELPDARVVVLPDDTEAVEAVDERRLRVAVERVPVADIQIGRLEEIAPRAELELARCRISVTHRARVAVAAQIELVSACGLAPVEAVERPQVGGRCPDGAKQTAEGLVHLLRQA